MKTCIPTLTLALLAAPLSAAAAQEAPVDVASRIAEVTVYTGDAIVRRTVPLPASQGSFRIAGLPGSLSPDSLRVRCSGGEVLGVDLRRVDAEVAGDERIAALEAAVEAARRGRDRVEDDHTVAARLVAFAEGLLEREREAYRRALAGGAPGDPRWVEGAALLEERCVAARLDAKRAEFALRDAREVLAAAELELSSARRGSGQAEWELVADVVGGRGLVALEVEYLVSGASWTPVYDLRADADLLAVELVYRAEVRQTTGEDWLDVPILLSTARPRLGARGPEPSTRWIGLWDPDAAVLSAATREMEPREGLMVGAEFKDLDSATATLSFAGVEDAGISARFRLPRQETVESRDEPTTLLVGRHRFAVAVEHVAVPSLSERVWLRAQVDNDSPWALLPGRAAVYHGGDFVGRSSVALAQVGQELDLHLGADPNVTVERAVIEDLADGPGFLRSKARRTDGWRITVANHGAAGVAEGRPVTVVVQEPLARSRDDSVTVELGEVSPPLSKAARWVRDREERGALTWELPVPAGGEASIRWTREVTYPEGAELVER